ncbi:MAG TPA: fumarylacetoacetate hydrolase family protein [Solirubrobacterales bacterium]
MASWRREPNSPRGGDLNVSSQRGEEFRVDERAVRVLHDGQPVWGRREGDEIVLPGDARIAEADAHYLAPAEPTKVIAVHLTYRSRIEEYKARTPAEPSYFMKPPTALNGHRGEVRRPKGTSYLNYEGELAVVIGRRMHGVPVEEALDYVAGYTCANDVGLHDFRHADRGSMLRVKGQDGFLPLGPELVPAGEFDPTSFTLRTYLNGEVVQEADASDLIWGVAYQLADLCRLITLEPGDVVLTGTPANSRPMEPGDVVEVEIDGIGRLTNTVREWDVDLSGCGEQPQVSAATLHVALAIDEEEAERTVEGVR